MNLCEGLYTFDLEYSVFNYSEQVFCTCFVYVKVVEKKNRDILKCRQAI